MRKIELKDRKEFKDVDLLGLIITTPNDAQKGLVAKDIIQGAKILDKLESDRKILLLEEADWQWLKDKMIDFKWAKSSRELRDFIVSINEAEEVKIKEVKC
jgi:hypothetical protein